VIETQTTGAHAFLSTLKANGIDTMFGLPGSTEAPLLEALRADAGIRYVLTLQETVTVAMADGYARAGNRVGVVGLHTTVGTMNGLSQIYNAARDNSPIVVTAGNKDTGVLAADGFCALPDLPSLERRGRRSAPRDQRRGGESARTDVSLDPRRRASRLRRSGRCRCG
jgi:benzoylformate decarboxylase